MLLPGFYTYPPPSTDWTTYGTLRSIQKTAVYGSPVPTDNLVLWLDATKITGLADNQGISTLTDYSPAAHTITTVNAATYRTNIQNGLPAIRFNQTGNDDGYYIASHADFNFVGNAVTIYVVVGRTYNDGAWWIHPIIGRSLGGGSVAKSYMGVYGTSGEAVGYWHLNGNLSMYIESPATIPIVSTGASVVEFSVFPSSGNYRFNIVDNAEEVAYQINSGGFSDPNAAVYLGWGEGSWTTFTGDIYELLWYKEAHSAATRTSLRTYLEAKWGIV